MSSLFPNATIGRNSGSKLLNTSTPLDGSSPPSPVQLTPSSTHPLLASTPSSSSISHPSSSPENSSNLPYQPRKRTPGGSITSLPPTSPSHPASTSANPSPTTASSNDPSSAPPPHPSIVPLFSNPVVPTISTSQLDSSGLSSAGGEGSSPTTTSSSIVTTRLKLTSLKAEAQKGVGLSNDSLGMKMLETMVQKGGEKSWEETMELVVGKSKMTLLLPFATPSSRGGGGTGSDGGSSGGSGSGAGGAGAVTVEMVREHLMICEGGGKKEGGIVVTLGGLVGRIEDDALTFYSFIPTDGPLMASLIDPLTRSQTLSSLNLPIPSPIPTTPISSFGISHPFPYLTPLLYSSTLPFPPPLPPASLAPALPNRPRATSSVLPGMTVAPSRMGNPFAGLFGSRRPAPAATPPPPAPAPLPSSDEKTASGSGSQQLYPPPTITMGEKGTAVPEEDEAPSADAEQIERPNSRGSLRKVASSAELPRETETKKDGEEEKIAAPAVVGKEDTMVSAWGVDKAIKRGEIEKLIGRAMRSLIEKELEGLPSSVVNGVKRFISLPHPPTSHSRSHPPFPKVPSRSNRLSMVPTPTLSTISPPVSYSDPEACSNTYQTFFGLVHDELESSWSRGGGGEEGGDVDAAERDKKERELEAKVVEGVSRVEGVVMRWGYNLLFSPAGSNDSKHDVALSSRIAALCMLDLSLDHLGVVTYKKDGSRDEVVVKGLDEIMRSVGEEFKRLESSSHQTPKSQCDVLVRAHKIVIEGLRLLPPIRLRPENEEWTPPPSSLTTALSPSSSTHSSPHRPTKLLPTTGSLSTTPEEGSNSNEAGEKTPKGMGSKEWEGGKEGVVPSLVLEGGVGGGVGLEGMVEDTSTVKTPMMEAMEESVMGSARDLSASAAAPTPTEPSTSSEPTSTSLPIPPPSSAAMSLVSSGSSIASSVLSNETEPAADSGGGTSGADLLLPIIIYATVKSNPSKLVSHLLYIQRYRASMCFSGESSYALVNVTAVVEFLENVDPGSLGLGDSDKVLSVELPPIDFDLQKDLLPSTTSSSTTAAQTAALAAQSRLRGRVSQVGELATSGLNNVVDTGLGALRSFIGTSQAAADGLLVQVPSMPSVPGMRPTQTRRASAFSIASITASVAGIGSKERGIKDGGGHGNGNGGGAGNANEWGAKREMVDVSTAASTSSRPGSIYERVEGSGGSSDEEGSSGSGSEDGELRAWKKGGGGGGGGGADDSRSVRSVSSYRSGKADSLQVAGSPTSLGERSERMSISERLATVGLSSPSSVPKANPFHSLSSPPSSSYSSPIRTSVSGASAAASTHSRRASLLGGTPWVPPPALLSKTTSPPQSPTPSVLPPLPPSQTSSPAPSLQLPSISNELGLGSGGGTVAPPNERFLSCNDEGDLKLNEVGELLREYRRLAGVLKQVGVWD